ncbi:MAG TPA: hypothetical protein VJY62_06880 [Bacteroidia bacterium]|nr:hypothetical protein [Bacteroidia bacterium]
MAENNEKHFETKTKRKLQLNSFLKLLQRPVQHPGWVIKNNLNRVFAFVGFVILFAINLYLIPPPEGEKYKHFWEIINSNLHHVESALLIYALLEGRIRKFLVSAKASEAPELVMEDYLIDILDSNKEIKILETFTELLLQNNYEIEKHFEKYILKCKRNVKEAKIRMLLIDPRSQYAIQRIKELKPYYEPDTDETTFVTTFSKRMNDWLLEIRQMKDRLTKNGTDNEVIFDIRIYDADPPYSLYSANNKGYFGYYQKRPTTKSPQLIIHDLDDQFGKYQLKRYEDIWNSNETTVQTISLDDYLSTPEAKDYIELFDKLKQVDNGEIARLLSSLEPKDTASDDEFQKIVALIKHLQRNYYKGDLDGLSYSHYNSFGTGGDDKDMKTINITTISSILASHYKEHEGKNIHIGKVGTLAVSCEVGSHSFDLSLKNKLKDPQKIKQLHPKLNVKSMYYAKGSRYIAITDLNYDYTIKIREVRKELFEKKDGRFVDIYKIVFPFSNFTKNSGQLNGVSNDTYLFYYKKLFHEFQRTGIIVFNSAHCIDEFFEGINEIYIYYNGNLLNPGGAKITIDISVPKDKKDEYLNFFKESTEEEHVEKFFQLFDKEHPIDDSIKMTFAYNIAAIIMVSQIREQLNSIKETAKEVFDKIVKEVFNEFFGQKGEDEKDTINTININQ